MSTYRMDDGTVVKTENAVETWDEDTYWDGHNHISKATGQQFRHERLYKSRKGRYWIEHSSQWQGEKTYASWVGNHAAAQWLLANGHELPSDLKPLEEDVSE
jgi:hypothetical protein